MIIPLWLRAAVAAAILATIVGIGWAIHHMIWKSGYNAHMQEQALAEKSAIAQRVAENHDELLAQEIWRNAKQKEYDDEIKALRTRIAGADRLRVSNGCGGSAGSTESKGSASGNGGDTGTRLVSPKTQRDFDELEYRVEQVFAGCRIAQEFIKKNE